MDNMSAIIHLVGRSLGLMRSDRSRTAVIDCLYNGVDICQSVSGSKERVDTLCDFFSAFIMALSEYVEDNI